MAREYLLVLKHLNFDCIVVGRSEQKIETLKSEFPDFSYFSGGILSYLKDINTVPEFAINAVSINQLESTSIELINAGVKNLLIEKPGSLSISGLQNINYYAKKNGVNVSVAYNRRFYSSIRELRNQLDIDGGVISVHFEFTEWVHTIDTETYEPEGLEKWILSNSSHVIDTVFHIIGLPVKLQPIIMGKGKISWHPSGSIFIGSGISNKGIPFSYHSNWLAPGRWSIEVLTQNRRFYLKPMEKLHVQLKGSIQVNEFGIEDEMDFRFKPGLLLQTKAFLNLETDKLVSISEQIEMMHFYDMIGGY